MNVDGNERWLQALAGLEAGQPDDSDAREGRALRAQIGALSKRDVPAQTRRDPAREEQLIGRARVAGLLPTEPTTQGDRIASRGRWPMPRIALLLAAGLATVVIGVSLMRERAATDSVRGAANDTVLLRASNPRALQQTLILELKAVGVNATGYQRLDRVGLDADVPKPLPPEVRQVLERHQIPMPTDGALVIEIQTLGTP